MSEMYENKLVTCPYDEAHKLKFSRLQAHITKCKLNHLNATMEICPFNATHVVTRGEFQYHLKDCPDRESLGRHISTEADKNNPYKGRIATPRFSDPHLDDDENWDLDAPAVNLSARQQPAGAIVQPPEMAKPAERKRLYRSLHLQSSDPQSNTASADTTEVLRQPKHKSQGEKVQVQQMNTTSIENLGLGRGRSSRIAANFDVGSNTASANAMYSRVVKNTSHLGLARGQSIPQAAAPVFESDDFPALGCGRGAYKAPKQNVRTPGAKPEK